jgi:hypothetical protein
MHFDVVGPLYSETIESEAFSWNLKRGGSYTNYPSYPSGTKVLLAKFGVIEESASILLDIDYYYGSSTEQTYSTSFTGGTTETKTNGSLFSVTYDASSDEIYLTSLNANVHHAGGYAYASEVHNQVNKMQFVFGKQSDEYSGGDCSASIGMSCEARGDNSFATGDRTSASGDSAFASGKNTSASGEASVAEGASTVASGDYSHSEGYETEASGIGSHASGIRTVADGYGQTAVGKYNTRNSSNLFVVGNGTSNSNRSDAFGVDSAGNGVFSGTISASISRLQNANVITVNSTNATLVYAEALTFGSITQICVRWKNKNAITIPADGNISGNVDVGTLNQDIYPYMYTAAHSNGDNAGAAWYTITNAGELKLGAMEATGTQRTVPANTEFWVWATYISAPAI